MHAIKNEPGIIVDLFAGGGGASVGIEAGSGRHVDIALNHDPVALAVHEANHPGTQHLKADIWTVSPRAAVAGRKVDLLWASPDCTHFSSAKGGQPRKQNIRSLAWAVVKWAAEVRPTLIIIENVKEFRGWGPLDEDGHPIIARMGETFRRWRAKLERLGYTVDFRVLDASLYGAPTRRRRLFLVARCDMQPIRWPAPTHGPGLRAVRTAAECIDWELPMRSIFPLRHAEPTLRRIAAGVFRYCVNDPNPYLVTLRNHVTARSIDEPLDVVAAKGNHHALVQPIAANPFRIETAFTGKADSDRRSWPLDLPFNAVTAQQTGALIAPIITNTRNGERHGQHGEQAPRVFDVREPMRTVTAKGSQGAVVAAFLGRHINPGNGGVDPGTPLTGPMPTVMTIDQKALIEAQLGDDLQRAEQVSAFLFSYYGADGKTNGASLRAPLPTVTTHDRFGLVMVKGRPIVDILMRMLAPHELLRAQFGRFAESYDISAATSARDKVRLIGNSVAPEVAEAVVRANLTPDMDLYGQGDLFTGLAAA